MPVRTQFLKTLSGQLYHLEDSLINELMDLYMCVFWVGLRIMSSAF
jgi:hypothetical protein